MNKTSIYVLIDPSTNEIRYVGKTTQRLCNRLSGHMKADFATYSGRWIGVLGKRGLRPKIHLIDEALDDWPDRERYWIKFFREAGCRLTNVSAGGDGHNGFYTSPETIRKITEKNLGKKRSPEFCANLSKRSKGKPKSDEQKKKISESLRGRKLPREVVEKVAASQRGKPRKPTSAATRAKIGEKNRGKIRTPEFRAKISAAHRGRALTPEHRRNISEGAKKRWQRVREQ